MNICTFSDRASVKLNSLRILIGIIHPNQKFFQYTDNELINQALSLDQVDRSNSILLLSLLLFILLLFIAFTLTDTGILIGFNVTNG